MKLPLLTLVASTLLFTASAVSAAPSLAITPGNRPETFAAVTADGAALVTTSVNFWADNYAWAGVKIADGEPIDGGRSFTWNIAKLGLTADGHLSPFADGRLTWRWDFRAARDLPDTGEKRLHGGLVFKLALASPARAGHAAQPVLRDDRRGWSWEVTPGQVIAAEFAEPLAQLYFEKGNPAEIRAMFFRAPVPAGASTQALSLVLPTGSVAEESADARFAPASTSGWFTNVLSADRAFVDLSSLNEKPAGARGFVTTRGADFIFADGTPVRFWGTSVQAHSVFPRVDRRSDKIDHALIDRHAARLAALGVNLVRLHQQDTNWAKPNLIADGPATDRLNEATLDGYLYWIHALKKNGIYVWVDLMTYHHFKPGDDIPGFDEILANATRKAKGSAKKKTDSAPAEGFIYLNARLEEIWRTRTRALLTRKNPYTGLTLAEDPAIAGYTLLNENTLTVPHATALLNKDAPHHAALYDAEAKKFSAASGLPVRALKNTWEAGPGTFLTNHLQHDWTARNTGFLRSLGVRVPVCTGHIWTKNYQLYSLPALTSGDVTDAHKYTGAEFLRDNPHVEPGVIGQLAMAQLADRPMLISEYNMSNKTNGHDEFTMLPYLATLAAFQGWDAPMFYGYSQNGFRDSTRLNPWDSYAFTTLIGASPAAALLFRAGHVSPARETVVLQLNRDQTFLQNGNPAGLAALRTLPEQHRLAIALPATPELPWLKATPLPPGARIETDLTRDHLDSPDRVTADTGEFTRDWKAGTFLVDTPKSQLVTGALGGTTLRTADVEFAVASPQALVAFSSLDGQPLATSRRILVTALGRVRPGKDSTILSEPVSATLRFRSSVTGLQLAPLDPAGGNLKTSRPLPREGDAYIVTLPTDQQTHWFELRAPDAP